MIFRCLSLGVVFSALLLATACEQHEANGKGTVMTASMRAQSDVIREKVEDYVNAINSRNVEAVVNQWSDKAVYKNPLTGELVNGRKGIRSELKKIFQANDQAKIQIDVKDIRFPVDEKAVEEGIATITIPGKQPLQSDFKMIYVLEDGDWLILHVSQLGFGLEEIQ